jgi:hypothetical protein
MSAILGVGTDSELLPVADAEIAGQLDHDATSPWDKSAGRGRGTAEKDGPAVADGGYNNDRASSA